MPPTALRPAKTALRCLSRAQCRRYSSPVIPQTSPFAPRHLLSIADLTPAELTTLVRNAHSDKLSNPGQCPKTS